MNLLTGLQLFSTLDKTKNTRNEKNTSDIIGAVGYDRI